MIKLTIQTGDLERDTQRVITDGFLRHTDEQQAPRFNKERINWLAYEDGHILVGALTADLLWDWLYIDELWVIENKRGTGLGRELMSHAEAYAASNNLVGLWLWTQSWQAAGFYNQLGYKEFTRFDDFPKGHARIGLRKEIAARAK